MGLANAEAPSLSSMEEEEEELRELAEKMGQLDVYDVREERRRRKSENKREDETKNKKKREKEREASKEEEEAELLHILRKPVEDKNTAQSPVTANHGVNRAKRSSQLDPGAMKGEQPSATNFKAGADETKQEGEWSDTHLERAEKGSRGEEEQLAHSYVIVEHHKK